VHVSTTHPLIGIVGSAGAYGRWLRVFFERRMGLAVIGHDPADPGSASEAELVERADVLVFSAPIRITPTVIDHYAALAAGREARQLWLDITSVKSGPVAAMLRSGAEVAGLHPMTAPPKTPTLKGRVVVVCRARVADWAAWLDELLVALEGAPVATTPEHHDRVMALVQAMAHATHLAQAGVLRGQAAAVGTLAGLLPFRSALFEMDMAVVARILSLNPAIYEDIQFGNPHSHAVLRELAAQLQRIAALVEEGTDAARAAVRREFLADNRAVLGAETLADGNYTFERVAYLLADLNDTQTLSVHLPEDRPGSLRALLAVFERHGVNIASLHSSRNPEGQLHFRFGFDSGTADCALAAAAREIDETGIGHVLR
jgi:prephenate dehydrogenase